MHRENSSLGFIEAVHQKKNATPLTPPCACAELYIQI